MQFERFYSLNQSVVAWFAHLHQVGFQPTLTNLGNFCGGIQVNVKSYVHPQPEKALKQLKYVCHGHGMQFERFYSLNQSVVAWFAHLHQVGFQPTLPNLGNPLWWQKSECEAMCSLTT